MGLLLLKAVIFLVVVLELHVVSDARNIPNYVKNNIFKAIETAAGGTQCASDLKSLVHDLMSKKRWALEMIDSSGKLPSGLLAGHIAIAGSFDQCIEISEQKNNSLINGQYCTVLLTSSKKHSGPIDFLWDTATLTDFLGIRLSKQSSYSLRVIKMNYGLCIPHSCSIGHLKQIWDYIETTFKAPVHAHFEDFMCRSNGKEVEPYFIDKYIISFFVVYIFILIVCTWYDLIIHQQIDGKQDNYIVAFSLFTNARKLFSFTSSSLEETGPDLRSINGMKVVSMLWVIIGHRTVLNFYSGVTNTLYIYQLKGRLEASFLFAGSYAVDTFLVLGSLLLSYGILKNKDNLEKMKRFPVIPMYIYRLFRLTPALFATVLFYMSIFKTLGDGPSWPLFSRKISGTCALNWWATLLYVSNYMKSNLQCVEQSWYLSVDSQLFMIAPIIMIYFLKKPWKTVLVCIGACILSGIYAFVITIQNEYGAFYIEGTPDYYAYIYTSTLVRMPPWFIGLIFGFLIHKYQDIKIPLVTNLFLWTCTIALLLTLILVHLLFTRNDDYNAVRAALFNSCARQAWGLGVGTVVFLCSTGHGGIINKWLSLPIFQVLVKLSYSIYLVQLAVISYFVGSKRHSDYFGYTKLVLAVTTYTLCCRYVGVKRVKHQSATTIVNVILISLTLCMLLRFELYNKVEKHKSNSINYKPTSAHDCMGDLIFIFVAATIWCLAFESPFVVIGKTFLNKELKKLKESSTDQSLDETKKKKKGYVVCVYKYEEGDKSIKKLK